MYSEIKLGQEITRIDITFVSFPKSRNCLTPRQYDYVDTDPKDVAELNKVKNWFRVSLNSFNYFPFF